MQPLLSELVLAAKRRGERARPPHCAICARYANENLEFQSLLAHIDAMGPNDGRAAAATIGPQLESLNSVFRQQIISADDCEAILSAPSWPLTRSLVVDLFNPTLSTLLVDPRLASLESLTLLGGGYGGPDISPDLIRVLVDSPALANVRRLSLHSGEWDRACSEHFWTSEFAARLRVIDGVPCEPQMLSRPLQVETMRGVVIDFEAQQHAFLRLADPQVTPCIRDLDVEFGGADIPIDGTSQQASHLARLDACTLRFGILTPRMSAALESLHLPRPTRVVLERVRKDRRRFSVNCETLTYVDFSHEDLEELRELNVVDDFGATLFDFDVVDRLPRGLRSLKVLAPEQACIAIVRQLEPFDALEELMLVSALTDNQLVELGDSAVIRRLRKFQLISDVGPLSPYNQGLPEDVVAAFHSPLSSEQTCALFAKGHGFAAIPEVEVITTDLEVARTEQQFPHVNIRSQDAAKTFAGLQTHCKLPIESLTFDINETPTDGDGSMVDALAALASAGAFDDVHRLELNGVWTEASVKALTAIEGLASVRSLSVSWTEAPTEVIAELLNGPHWDGVQRLHCNVARVADVSTALANSLLLPRIVSLATHSFRLDVQQLAASRQLPLLRQLNEVLQMRVFGDARVARHWLAANVSPPLRARLERFLGGIYDTSDPRPPKEIFDGLKSKLTSPEIDRDEKEQSLATQLPILLAKTFGGEPLDDGVSFTTLDAEQQTILRELTRLLDGWWGVGSLVRPPIASYGLPPTDRGLHAFVFEDRGTATGS